jgi:hypothetical protein
VAQAHCNGRVNHLLTFACRESGNRRVCYLVCKTYEVTNPKRALLIKVQVMKQDHKERLRGGACHTTTLFRFLAIERPKSRYFVLNFPESQFAKGASWLGLRT